MKMPSMKFIGFFTVTFLAVYLLDKRKRQERTPYTTDTRNDENEKQCIEVEAEHDSSAENNRLLKEKKEELNKTSALLNSGQVTFKVAIYSNRRGWCNFIEIEEYNSYEEAVKRLNEINTKRWDDFYSYHLDAKPNDFTVKR
jgi:hypothetical protein